MQKGLYARPGLAGLSDGITWPLVAAAASTGASVAHDTILMIIAGVTVVGAALFGVANYLTIQEEREPHHHDHAFEELQVLPQEEKEAAIEQIRQEQEQWLAAIENGARHVSPFKSALTISGCFALGSSVVLCSYYFNYNSYTALLISTAIALPVLFFTGAINSRFYNKSMVAGAVRNAVISIAAAGAAYGAAYIFTLK